MSNLFTWKGTSMVINCDSENSDELIDILENEGIKLRSGNILENQSNYFIFENEFINQETNLITILTKLKKKKYENRFKFYITNSKEFQFIKSKSDDRNKYKNIISQNIIDGDIRELDISLNIINETLDDSVKSGVLLDILILLALANKSSYSAEDFKAEFRTDDNYYRTKISIINDNPIGLYPIYNWIINDDEYEESYNVKLHIVRQVIAIKQDIKDVDGILEDSKLAHKRIISKKTDDYFDQLNQLKDDFLTLSKNENTALRTLHVTFFAWIGYVGIELFNIITKYDGTDILHYLFCSQGIKKGLVILMFIAALTIIFVGYVSEIKSLQKTYNVIRTLYKDKILFETDLENESKFETIIKKPRIGYSQLVIFIIIMLGLAARFLIAVL